MDNLILVSRATGKGSHQLLEVDLASASVVAAWPIDATEDTPRTAGRDRLAPSSLAAEQSKAYRAAVRAWDKAPFNFDAPLPVVPAEPAPRNWSTSDARYVARLHGADPTYRFARAFLDPVAQSPNGRHQEWFLRDGIYEVSQTDAKLARKIGRFETARKYLKVIGGVVAPIDWAEVEAAFPPLPRTADPAASGQVVECLECGATYPASEAHEVDPGGMGCVRCGGDGDGGRVGVEDERFG